MRRWVAAGLLGLALSLTGARAADEPVAPFELAQWTVPGNAIDTHVFGLLKQQGLAPALPCADEVFCRRVYLDVIGTLPEPADVTAFLADQRPDKRAQLIETLLQRPEYADYWAMKWCDALRVKSEFPINLWPNAVQAYQRWVHDALATNLPYDQMARELLTSNGSNFRVPPVNFYRAVQGRDPSALAEAVALTFMGTRLANWPAAERANLAVFFSRLQFKGTDEWKEEIVQLDPKVTEPLKVVFPDGTPAVIPAGADPRRLFAAWLVDPHNAWFARAAVNRQWAWLLGRGIVHEADDLRPDNPPANPALLAYLERELVASHYDLRQVLRLILNSRVYQQSSIARNTDARGVALCASYPVRRLDAEVLSDALYWLTAEGELLSSPIPEPFTWIPKEQRAIALADGSITGSFLEMFGRPTRDTGLLSERSNTPSDEQALYLLNSTDLQRRLERSPRLRQIAGKARGVEAIRQLYLLLLSRYPTPAELAKVAAYGQTAGMTPGYVFQDVAWGLINSKEFLYRH